MDAFTALVVVAPLVTGTAQPAQQILTFDPKQQKCFVNVEAIDRVYSNAELQEMCNQMVSDLVAKVNAREQRLTAELADMMAIKDANGGELPESEYERWQAFTLELREVSALLGR